MTKDLSSGRVPRIVRPINTKNHALEAASSQPRKAPHVNTDYDLTATQRQLRAFQHILKFEIRSECDLGVR